MTTIISKMRKTDGALLRVHEDGREDVTVKRPVRPMTEGEAEASALGDPNAHPLTDAERARAISLPRARVIRRALGLTQEEFAARYHIPVGTLRDWEQGRAMPDQPARAYLRAIAGDPSGVSRALDVTP